MAEITLTINGRSFGISCDDGQEQRVMDLGHYVDARLKDIARAGAASNESHLLVLTSLMMADEVYDLRAQVTELGNKVENLGGEAPDMEAQKQDELVIAQAIDHLAERIDTMAGRIQGA